MARLSAHACARRAPARRFCLAAGLCAGVIGCTTPTPPRFATQTLPPTPTVVAPDGSDVRVLLRLQGGSMAHFSLAPGRTSLAVAHRTVEELWYITAGEGQMWRAQGDIETVVSLRPGVSLSIPLGTRFQFRSTGAVALEAVAITLPPWPDTPDEAYAVPGPWAPSSR